MRVWTASLLAMVWGLLALDAWAQEPGTAARLGMGARPLALGGAFVAIPDDASAVFWNPAGLATLTSPRISLHYRRVSTALAMDAVNLASGPSRHGVVWGGTLSVLHRAGVPSGDALGGAVGQPGDREIQAQLLMGVRAGAGFAFGVGAGPIVTSLAADTGRVVGWGGNAGLLWSQGGTSVGFGLLGLTAGLGTAERPQSYRYRLSTGVAQRIVEPLLVSVQLDRDRGADPTLLSGIEWNVVPACALRSGFEQAWTGDSRIPVFSGGLGLQQGRFQMDYAVRVARQATPEHLLSLRFRLGAMPEARMPSVGAAAGPHAAVSEAGTTTQDSMEDTAPQLPAEPAPRSIPTHAPATAPTPTQHPAPFPPVSTESTQPAEPQLRTLPVGLKEPGPPPGHASDPTPHATKPDGTRAAPVPDPTRVRYVVRAGVHSDMDQAALEIARFYRARIRPDLERRGDLYIVVVHRCDTLEEARGWVQQARQAGLQCTIDEE